MLRDLSFLSLTPSLYSHRNIRVISFDPQKDDAKYASFYIDGPISTVQLTTKKKIVDGGGLRDSAVHLLVASLAGFACIYKCDLLTPISYQPSTGPEEAPKNFFDEPQILEDTLNPGDSVLCIYEAQFPTLGGSCIFVGTYKGQMMVFEKSEAGGYSLSLRRKLPHSIHKFGIGDINNDGIVEVVVLTKYSVHVFARSIKEIAQMSLQRGKRKDLL